MDPSVSCGQCSVETGEVLPDLEDEHLEVHAVRRIARCCIAIYAIGVPALYLGLLLTILPELREVTPVWILNSGRSVRGVLLIRNDDGDERMPRSLLA